MYKFVTIRCRSCGSVIYNLQEKEFHKLKLVSLTCEDCIENSDFENSEIGHHALKEIITQHDNHANTINL